MNTENKWEISYKGNLVALEKHTEKGFERAVRPPGVRLVLSNDEGKILMTKEFRGEQGKHDIRLPGGKVFDDLQSYLEVRGNEAELMNAVMAAANLEAKQETGTEIENLELIQKNSCGATVEWDLYYVSADIKEVGEQELDGDEKHHGIEIGFYSKSEILDMIKSGEISEDRSISVLITKVLADII